MSSDPAVDSTVPHPARRYNYWLDGKDNFAADRASGDAIKEAFPQIVAAARENRRFLGRAVKVLGDLGVRQFLDIGTGLPTAGNTHEVAQAHDPSARVVYVDNDPLVLAHARALLTSHPEGRTAYLQADLRDPEGILADPELAATLDLDEPVALLLVAVLHFVGPGDDPYGLVRTLLDRLPSGSYLVLTHATSDLLAPQVRAKLSALPSDFTDRSEAEVRRFFDGLEMLEPGLVVVSEWRLDEGATPVDPSHVSVWGAVARKP